MDIGGKLFNCRLILENEPSKVDCIIASKEIEVIQWRIRELIKELRERGLDDIVLSITNERDEWKN